MLKTIHAFLGSFRKQFKGAIWVNSSSRRADQTERGNQAGMSSVPGIGLWEGETNYSSESWEWADENSTAG